MARHHAPPPPAGSPSLASAAARWIGAFAIGRLLGRSVERRLPRTKRDGLFGGASRSAASIARLVRTRRSRALASRQRHRLARLEHHRAAVRRRRDLRRQPLVHRDGAHRRQADHRAYPHSIDKPRARVRHIHGQLGAALRYARNSWWCTPTSNPRAVLVAADGSVSCWTSASPRCWTTRHARRRAVPPHPLDARHAPRGAAPAPPTVAGDVYNAGVVLRRVARRRPRRRPTILSGGDPGRPQRPALR